MRTEYLLDQCLQALASGEDLPPDVAKYLSRHPEQRAEVEDLLSVAQTVSRIPAADLSTATRSRMQRRLAETLGFDPVAMPPHHAAAASEDEQAARSARRRLHVSRLPLAKLRYAPPEYSADDPSDARIRAAFLDLTPEDIRRYIGVRGEDYLYYRQRLPGWEPVFHFLAFVLRGFKLIERLVAVGLGL